MSRRLSPLLTWGLAGTLLASAWALWWPQQATAPAAVPANAVPPAPNTPAERVPAPVAAPVHGASAGGDQRPMLSPPDRDPFNPAPPPPPPAPVKAQVEPSPRNEAATAPPPPAAPRMEHRVVGRFKSPDGQQLVFLQDGPQTVAAAPGVTLASGYVVESVTPREIRLRHPLADQAVSLPLPEDNSP